MRDAPLKKLIRAPERTAKPAFTSAPDGDDVAEEVGVVTKKKRAYMQRAKKIKVPKQLVMVDDETRSRTRATAFTPSPPPVVSPWPYEFPAPTSTYDQKIACPIDWSQIEIDHNNPQACQEAYELRRPWNEKPTSWSEVANQISMTPATSSKSAATISSVGARKRFVAANKAVFNQSGVYFAERSLGLDELLGVPSLSEALSGSVHHGRT
jgi:hypothetical protein